MKQKLKRLSRENLEAVLLELAGLLSEEQCQKLDDILETYAAKGAGTEKEMAPARMSQELVDEKMKQVEEWMEQIDQGELCLDAEEYEDRSYDYWERDWITEYYDNQGVGNKISTIIQFARDCVDDRRYQEANGIYEWLWDMSICAESELGECDPLDLEMLEENGIIHTNMEQLALLTLYADYQARDEDERAEDLYLYFTYRPFENLHIEDMFSVGREELTGTEQFWKDWIELLKTKGGDVAARLLKEAVLYREGVEGLVRMAAEQGKIHPSLYLAAMEEYAKQHDYGKIEEIGALAMGNIDRRLVIRGEAALKAAYASSCLMHTKKTMLFCWEAFCSDSTDKNFLRLFGTKEMAEQYGVRGKEILNAGLKGEPAWNSRDTQMRHNVLGDYGYDRLRFYTGDFEAARLASKNPHGSLEWSSSFIRQGIRLFLLYLYEKPLPTQAAALAAADVGFQDDTEISHVMGFESEIIEESRRNKTSVFWNYFQRWKPYFQMGQEERGRYLKWAENIVRGRADAIVGGQHRKQYGEAALLLALAADVKESMGRKGAKQAIYAEYKRKFPRHSSFQGEMKRFFGNSSDINVV